MAIKSVSLGIGFGKFMELSKVGIPAYNQDWEAANAARRAEMLKAGKTEVRTDVGDTGVKIFEKHFPGSTLAVSGSELVETILSSATGAVVSLKVRDRRGHKSYFLIVREAEVGFEASTDLTDEALAFVKKSARKWFKSVVIWSNPDATITVNLFQNLSQEDLGEVEEVKQVRFEGNKPNLV